MTIGGMIKKIRLNERRTRREIVQSLDITEAYLCAIENNKRCPDIPRNGDGTLNIKESLYYKILTEGIKKPPESAESLILDWKLYELGVCDPSLKDLLKDSINGNLKNESKKAILATYLGLKIQKEIKKSARLSYAK